MPRTSILISDLRRDGGTQIRAEMDEAVAGEYAQAIQADQEFPDPIAFHDGRDYWLADGFHTVWANEIIGTTRLTVDVRSGTLRDAILCACGRNARHGKRRTPADVRRAVLLLLTDEEWGKKPNTWIAERVGITEARVRQIKKELRADAGSKDFEDPEGAESEGSWDEEAEIAQLPPAFQATWKSMTEAQREEVRQLAPVDALDERVQQIENLVERIKAKLGDGESMKSIRDGLKRYVEEVRRAVGWEGQPEVEITVDLLGELKPLFDQARRKHAEFPEARQLTRKLEGVWDRIERCIPEEKLRSA